MVARLPQATPTRKAGPSPRRPGTHRPFVPAARLLPQYGPTGPPRCIELGGDHRADRRLPKDLARHGGLRADRRHQRRRHADQDLRRSDELRAGADREEETRRRGDGDTRGKADAVFGLGSRVLIRPIVAIAEPEDYDGDPAGRRRAVEVFEEGEHSGEGEKYDRVSVDFSHATFLCALAAWRLAKPAIYCPLAAFRQPGPDEEIEVAGHQPGPETTPCPARSQPTNRQSLVPDPNPSYPRRGEGPEVA